MIDFQSAEDHLRSVAPDDQFGAFAVRDSTSSPGSFVLTWYQLGKFSHTQVRQTIVEMNVHIIASAQILCENGRFFIKALPELGSYPSLTEMVESKAVC